MSRQQWLSIIGVWVMVFSFLGFPEVWSKIIAVATGLIIIFISFKINTKNISKETSTYVENGEKSENNRFQ